MQRQDYILRLIDQLGAFLRQIWVLRKGGRPDEAVIAVVRAQETLMGASANEFANWSPEQQFERLVGGEPPERACERVFAYAVLMDTAAKAYRDKELDALAEGAVLLGEEMRVLARLRFPEAAAKAEEKFARLQPEQP